MHLGRHAGGERAAAAGPGIGLIKVALLAERQIERLVNWRYSRGLSPMLAGGAPGLNSGFSGAQLLATSLAAEARLLGTAASIQTIPTNANNQDVVSMGCIAAKMTRSVLPLCWKIIAIEALALRHWEQTETPAELLAVLPIVSVDGVSMSTMRWVSLLLSTFVDRTDATA